MARIIDSRARANDRSKNGYTHFLNWVDPREELGIPILPRGYTRFSFFPLRTRHGGDFYWRKFINGLAMAVLTISFAPPGSKSPLANQRTRLSLTISALQGAARTIIHPKKLPPTPGSIVSPLAEAPVPLPRGCQGGWQRKRGCIYLITCV